MGPVSRVLAWAAERALIAVTPRLYSRIILLPGGPFRQVRPPGARGRSPLVIRVLCTHNPAQQILYVHIKIVDSRRAAVVGSRANSMLNGAGGRVMARNLSKSNAHFKRALTRLPLGVASNFR